MEFSDFNERVQMYVSDLNDHLAEIVQENEVQIIKLNRSQMLIGQDAKGELMEPLKLLSYALEKKRKGAKAPTGIPDLKDTGDFQSAMILEVDDRSYYISSTDEKTGQLVDKYGEIFGLNEPNQKKAQAMNDKKLAVNFKQAVGL